MKIGLDKIAYFSVGALGFQFLVLFLPIPIAFLIMFFVAIGKEVYDYYHRQVHTPDIYDALIAMLGVIYGLVYLIIWRYLCQ